MPNGIFYNLRMRWLTIIIPLSIIVMIVCFEIFNSMGRFNGEDAIYAVLASYIGYFIPIIWVVLTFKKYKVSIKEMFFKRLEVKALKWWEIITVVTALILFSMATFYLIYIPLSYIMPSYVESLLEEKGVYTSADSAIPAIANILEFIMGVVLAPFVEELIFRGVMFNRFLEKWGIKAAIIAPSFLFGILHFNFIGAFVFGLIMTLLYIKTKSLIIPILCHILNNGIAYGITYITYFIEGEEVIYSLEKFRSELWIGIVCFVISTTFIIHFLYKNWPLHIITIRSLANEPIHIYSKTLVKANLSGFNLHRALLANTDLSQAKLVKAHLRNAELKKSVISNASFHEANLVLADCRGAILINCDFSDSICNHCDFSNADLSDANFSNAKVNMAVFNGAKLIGANMKCDDLNEAIFNNAIYDETTIWPENFNPKVKGAIRSYE